MLSRDGSGVTTVSRLSGVVTAPCVGRDDELLSSAAGLISGMVTVCLAGLRFNGLDSGWNTGSAAAGVPAVAAGLPGALPEVPAGEVPAGAPPLLSVCAKARAGITSMASEAMTATELRRGGTEADSEKAGRMTNFFHTNGMFTF